MEMAPTFDVETIMAVAAALPFAPVAMQTLVPCVLGSAWLFVPFFFLV